MVKGILLDVDTRLAGEREAEVTVTLVLTDETIDDVKNLISTLGEEYVLVVAPAIPE